MQEIMIQKDLSTIVSIYIFQSDSNPSPATH